MNIDELKQNLTAIASEADDSTSDRLGGVDSKVGEQRRNAVLATVGAAALVVGAVAFGSTLIDQSTDGPEPTHRGGAYLPDWRPTPIPTVDDNGVRFYSSPAGATLISHGVTRPGQDSATFSATPHDLHLGYASECFGPATGTQPRVEVRVNGTWFSGGRCQPYQGPDPLGPSYLPDEANWTDAGAEAGEQLEVTIRVVPKDRDLPNAAEVQLAAGVYQLSDNQLAHGLDRLVVSAGHTYVLRGVRSGVPDSHARLDLSIKTPNLSGDLLAVVGADGGSGRRTTTSPSVEGEALPQAAGTGWKQSVAVTNDGSVDATFSVNKDFSSTTQLFLAVYEQID